MIPSSGRERGAASTVRLAARVRPRAAAAVTPADGLMLGAMLIWGINITSVKVVVQAVPPLGFGLLRYSFASALLFGILRWREGSIGIKRRHLPWLAGSGAVGLGLNQVTFLNGISHISATLAAMILATAPVLTAVFAALWAREPLRRGAIAALTVSMAGVALVILGKNDRLQVSWLGSVLMLLAAATLGVGALLAKAPLRDHSSLRVTAWLSLFGGLVLFPFGFPGWLATSWTALNGITWLAIGFTLIGATILGNLAWNYSVQQLGAARTAAFTYLQPVSGVAFATLLLGERLALPQLIGGAVVICGQVLYSRQGRPKSSDQALTEAGTAS